MLVEAVSLEFHALGRLPGTLIKWFVDELDILTICSLLDGKDRSATAKCTFGYYDGVTLEFFDGSLSGEIATSPRGENGFGWDKIFIPEGYELTRAELNGADDEKTYTQIKPFNQVKSFLETRTT